MPMVEWSRRVFHHSTQAIVLELDVADGAERAGQERAAAQALGLVEADDAFHEGVVVGVADAADRRRDPLQRQVLGEDQRGVLRAGVVVVRQTAGDQGCRRDAPRDDS